MFGIGGFELFLILLFGFLIFGPDKLPQLAKTLGSALQKFRSAQDEVNKVVKAEIYDPLSQNPVKSPVDAMHEDSRRKVEGKESFAARKAKYDKEREDRLKREAANDAAAQARAAVKAEAAQARQAAKAASESGEVPSAAPSAAEVHDRVMAARKEASEQAQAQARAERAAGKDLADELLGMKKPIVKKAAATVEKEED